MGKTSISWTESTVQVTHGCKMLSPGCANCFAMRLVGTRLDHLPQYYGLTRRGPYGPTWTGEMRPAAERAFLPLVQASKPRMIFVNSLSDLFADAVEDRWIVRAYAAFALADQHVLQVLTKRPERRRQWLIDPINRERVAEEARNLARQHRRAWRWGTDLPWPLPWVWEGTSVEDRPRTARIDVLRETPAAVRFLSCEPLLEDLGPLDLRGIDQVIVGGESTTGKWTPRPMPVSAAEAIIRQCLETGVAVHFKQVGSCHDGWPPGITGKGDDPREWPAHLRIQQHPERGMAEWQDRIR